MKCPVCGYEGNKIEVKEDLEDKSRMYKFISCGRCGKLIEKQVWKMEGY